MTLHPHQLPELVAGVSLLATDLKSQGRLLSSVMIQQAATLIERAIEQLADEIAEDDELAA